MIQTTIQFPDIHLQTRCSYELQDCFGNACGKFGCYALAAKKMVSGFQPDWFRCVAPAMGGVHSYNVPDFQPGAVNYTAKSG